MTLASRSPVCIMNAEEAVRQWPVRDLLILNPRQDWALGAVRRLPPGRRVFLVADRIVNQDRSLNLDNGELALTLSEIQTHFDFESEPIPHLVFGEIDHDHHLLVGMRW